MHDIIITQLIKSEVTRMDKRDDQGYLRIPLQALWSTFTTQLVTRNPRMVQADDANGHSFHIAECACEVAR